MDTVSKQARSRIMASVRRRDTGPELLLRKALHRLGFRYRLHDNKLPGSPDMVLPKYRAVIFVHGCFWHRHGCKLSTSPSTRKYFWQSKFEANKKRDRRNNDILSQSGWRILIVWQCVIPGKNIDSIVDKVAIWLRSDSRFREFPRIVRKKV